MTENSERREHIGITVFENKSETKNALLVLNVNDETRFSNPDGASDLSVPGTQFDGQTHTHHKVTGQTAKKIESLSSLLGAF